MCGAFRSEGNRLSPDSDFYQRPVLAWPLLLVLLRGVRLSPPSSPRESLRLASSLCLAVPSPESRTDRGRGREVAEAHPACLHAAGAADHKELCLVINNYTLESASSGLGGFDSSFVCHHPRPQE